MGILAKNLLDLLLDQRHPGHAAHQNHLINFGNAQAGILQGRATRTHGALNQVCHQGFQFGSAQLNIEMFGPGGVGGDKGQVDIGFHGGGKLHLGLFRIFLEPLQSHFVLTEINSLVTLKFVGQPVDDSHVKVFTAEEGVPVGSFNLENPVADFQNRNIEGASTQVEDGDFFFLLFVQTISQGGGGRLVDNPLDVESGDLACIFGSLTLGVVEVGRHGDYRVGHLFPQILLGSLLHFGQHHGGNFRGSVFFAIHLNKGVTAWTLNYSERADFNTFANLRVSELAADQTLDGIKSPTGVGHRLTLGHLAHQALACVIEGHHRWGGSVAFDVGEHFRLATLHNRYAGIGCSQINTNDFTHD